MTDTIPGPKALPLIGNLLDLTDDEAPLLALERLAALHGPIFKLTRQGHRVLFVSSVEIMEEVCDEERFVKAPPAALAAARKLRAGEDGKEPAVGLFAARNEDVDWGQAHRILVPAFGPLAVEGQFERECFLSLFYFYLTS